MNKKLIYFLGAFMLCFAMQLSAQKPAVKSVEFKDFAKDKATVSLNKRIYTEYEKDGKMVKQEIYERNSFGSVVKQKVTQHREDDTYNYQEITQYDSLGVAKSKDVVVTDKNGKTQKTVNDVYNTDGKKIFSYYSLYKYDKAGKVAQVTMHNGSGKKIGQEKHSYNSDGDESKFTKWLYLDKDHKVKVTETKELEYDAKGNLAKTETVKVEEGPNGEKEYKEVILFERGMMTEWSKYTDGKLTSQYARGAGAGPKPKGTPVNPDEEVQKTFATDTEYDELDRKIKTTYTEDDVVVQINTFEYDENDNLTKTRKAFYDAEGTETNSEEDITEYDQYGSIIRKATVANGVLLVEQLYQYNYFSK